MVLFVSFVELVEVAFVEDEISFVWVVFNCLFEDNHALFQLVQGLAFDEGLLLLVFIEKVIP